MKDLRDYIKENLNVSEALKITKDSKVSSMHKYHPENKAELKDLIEKLIKERGNNADLNDIDTSKIDDMSFLFNYAETSKFNGDISKWDVSNVKNMDSMFCDSDFNGDISNWDVSNVTNMDSMFVWAKKFNGNISKWDVSNVKDMKSIFIDCPLEKYPPKWYR